MLDNLTAYVWLAMAVYAFYVSFRFYRIAQCLDSVCRELEHKMMGGANDD